MRADEIVDRKSFQVWLKASAELEHEKALVNAVGLMSLRILPQAIRRHCDESSFHYLAVLTILRCALILQLHRAGYLVPVTFNAQYGLTEVNAERFNEQYAYQVADETLRSALEFSGKTGTELTGSLILRANEVIHANSGLKDVESYFSVGSQVSIWDQLAYDLSSTSLGRASLEASLWKLDPPHSVLVDWKQAVGFMQTSGGQYQFWIRWYEALLAGRPLTGDWDSHWQLLHDIALISNADWEKGAQHVAGLIDLISQKHALQQEIKRAQKVLEHEAFNAMSLGHHRDNMPDDLLPSRILEYRVELQNLQTALVEVAAALEPPIPDVVILAEATGRLQQIWERLKKYPLALAVCAAFGTAATGAIGQAGARGMDWFLDEGAPAFVRKLQDLKPSPAPLKGWEKPPVDI